MNELQRLKNAMGAEPMVVLVMDKMPEDCYKCRRSFKGWNEAEEVFGLMCSEMGNMLIDCFYNERPYWCPFHEAIGIIEPNGRIIYFREDKS